MSEKYTEQELIAFMEPYDLDDLPDGAWFAHLEEGADAFIIEKKLPPRTDANSLVHDYLKAKG